MTRASKWTFVIALALLLTLPQAARAQDTSIVGVVTDATDARLPGVTVTALHVDTGNTYVAVTETAGQFQISGARTGVYKVTAELSGFRSVSQENVELLVGQRVVINFKLPLSSVDPVQSAPVAGMLQGATK